MIILATIFVGSFFMFGGLFLVCRFTEWNG